MRGTALVLAAAAAVAAAAGKDADFWRTQAIYQVLTDRFALPPGTPEAPCNDLSTYCGGTYTGITAHLDFVTDMGFDAVWVSPIPPNTPNGYHGYWQRCVVTAPVGDCTVLNQHFGTDAELKSMTAAGDAAGVAFMLDVVGNHMGGTIGDIGGFLPFNTEASYHNCDGCPADCNIESFENQFAVQHCRLAALPDLNQTSAYVAGTLQSWVKYVVAEYGFAGLRVDTVAEVNKPFWAAYERASGAFATGEVFNGDVAYVSSYQGSALTSLLSYPMYFTLRSVFASQSSMYGLQSQMQAYGAFPDTSVLTTFVDNHDNPRFLSVQKDWTLYTNALAWVLLARGIPIVYYGTAFGFDGGNDPANREAMWPAGYNISHAPLGQFLKAVNGVRASAGVTGGLAQTQRYADDGFYAFTRGASETDPASVFVALTNAGSSGADVTRSITYQPYPDGTQLCNALAADAATAEWGVSGRVAAPGGAATSTLMAAVRAASAAADRVGGEHGGERTAARVAAAAAATQELLAGAAGATAPDADCVTVQGGAFSVTLHAGEPKVYLPSA